MPFRPCNSKVREKLRFGTDFHSHSVFHGRLPLQGEREAYKVERGLKGKRTRGVIVHGSRFRLVGRGNDEGNSSPNRPSGTTRVRFHSGALEAPATYSR
jgi:hypothetical protein